MMEILVPFLNPSLLGGEKFTNQGKENNTHLKIRK